MLTKFIIKNLLMLVLIILAVFMLIESNIKDVIQQVRSHAMPKVDLLDEDFMQHREMME